MSRRILKNKMYVVFTNEEEDTITILDKAYHLNEDVESEINKVKTIGNYMLLTYKKYNDLFFPYSSKIVNNEVYNETLKNYIRLGHKGLNASIDYNDSNTDYFGVLEIYKKDGKEYTKYKFLNNLDIRKYENAVGELGVRIADILALVYFGKLTVIKNMSEELLACMPSKEV